jgi:hypothetical protein
VKAVDGRHLRDDQMIAVYIGAEPRFGRRDRTVAHLQGCAECVRRYQEFVRQMTDVRDEAMLEADAVFSPARLEMQRQQILQRLEHATHPARVIPFPAPATQNLALFTGSQMRRWIAAAAAAGLIIGVTFGRMAPFRPAPATTTATQITAPRVEPPRPAAEPSRNANLNDEEILLRPEQVQMEMQLPASLEALGAMTPIRDVALTLPPQR